MQLERFRSAFTQEDLEKGFQLEWDTQHYFTNEEIQAIDARYRMENTLLEAIKSGDAALAMKELNNYRDLMNMPNQTESRLSSDSLRNFKNSVNTMNTLFRKTVEEVLVPPIYIHEYSVHFEDAIESSDSIKDLILIIPEMIKKYCYLVRECSLAFYSRPIRDAIVYIELHLCAPISTCDLSAALSLTPNYLSSQFKKETGQTITEYIAGQRIKLALRYLNTTTLTISEISYRIGIGDPGYFSRIFKKQIGMSPLQYQKMMHK